MRDAAFREQQVSGLRDPHIAPINDLVDDIIDPAAGLWAPYVAPMYGGTRARLLSVLRDPGPKTNVDHGGSGFLCIENDDATAERISGLFANAGISVTDIVPWNAYPWYINRAPTAAQLEDGVEPLLALIGLMPNLQVVMLHGGSAHDGWRRLARRSPTTPAGLTVIETYHPSRQAFRHPDPAIRQQRADHLERSFTAAAAALARSGGHAPFHSRHLTDPDLSTADATAQSLFGSNHRGCGAFDNRRSVRTRMWVGMHADGSLCAPPAVAVDAR